MRMRQASARLMGTSEYFSINLSTGSIFWAISTAATTARRPQQSAETGSSSWFEKVETSDRTASQVDQGGGRSGAFVHRPLVVSVAVAKQRHHKPGVNEDVSGYTPWLANRTS